VALYTLNEGLDIVFDTEEVNQLFVLANCLLHTGAFFGLATTSQKTSNCTLH